MRLFFFAHIRKDAADSAFFDSVATISLKSIESIIPISPISLIGLIGPISLISPIFVGYSLARQVKNG